MRLWPPLLLIFTALLALLARAAFTPARAPLPSLTHEAYVWQRVHTSAAQAAVREHGPAFARLTYLAAELSWPSANSAPAITRVALPSSAPLALGLALRIHAYRGSFDPASPATRHLVSLAHDLVAATQASGHRVTELQLDFDASEAQLDAYRHWLLALRADLAPVPVSFTALPAWLDQPRAFARLARASDGFILQVHSLSLPTSPALLPPLCDTTAARRAVRLAARPGVPFRVALPTYGYEVAFDSRRRFLGLAAEGSARPWPADALVRTLRADPASLAALVSDFQRHRPSSLSGVLWYRLPVPGEPLNWPWPTLAAVMQGRAPAPLLAASVSRPPTDSALLCVSLSNSGEADAPSPPRLLLRWSGARRLAADTHHGFTFTTETDSSATLHAPAGFRLAPSTTQPVAWLRFDHSPTSFDVTLLPE